MTQFYSNMIFCWMFLVCFFIHYDITMMTMNQHDKILPKSQLNSLFDIKYNKIHLKSKTNMRKIQDNTDKVQEEREPRTEISRVCSQIRARAKNYQNMPKKKQETKQKARYNLLGSKVIKEKVFWIWNGTAKTKN